MNGWERAGQQAGSTGHRLMALWLLVTAPILAVPGDRALLRVGLLALHLVGAALLIREPLDARRLPGPPRMWRALRDWIPLMALPALYWEIPLLAGTLHGETLFDPVVQRWDAALFDGQPARRLAHRWPLPWLSETLHAAYLAYYLVLLVPPAALYLAGRGRTFDRLLFTILLTTLGHAVLFVTFPVAGPRTLFEMPDAIQDGPMFRLTRAILGAGSSTGTAFPSGHVGVSVAVTLAVARAAPRAAAALGLVTALMAVATVYGGYHYAVDALAGGALGLALATAAPRVQAWLSASHAGPSVSISGPPVRQSR